MPKVQSEECQPALGRSPVVTQTRAMQMLTPGQEPAGDQGGIPRCRERLEEYLREHGVPYELHEHPQAFTAQEVAGSEHVSGKKFAKVVIVLAGGRPAMLVLPASRKVDLAKAAVLLGDPEIRLAREREFALAFGDCEPGAMPPFGNLYGLPVLVDESLARQETVYFRAGSHKETMSIAFRDFVRLAHPLRGDFTKGID